MEQVVVALTAAVIPGTGPVLMTLNLVRTLYVGMKESKALCENLQTRLDATWSRLLKMEKEGTLPRTFKVADFTDILAQFHALVLKQAEKSFVVRVGTSGSFMKQLQACHEELDHLQQSFRDQAVDFFLQWRVEWERNVQIMQNEVAQFAAAGVAARLTSSSHAESNEALATLVHEQHKLLDHDQILAALQAICHQLAHERKLALPTSMPPWFFTFDDVNIEREPFHELSAATSMGTVHRATWGASTTRVVVKKIELPMPPKPKTSMVTWIEADVWWKLSHPNILRMFGACHVTTPAFIVCEEAKYGNVRDYLAANPIHKRRFWRLQLDVAVGLAHLKANRVVHGNLKVNNILIGDDGRAKITDFGFSIYIQDADVNETIDTTTAAPNSGQRKVSSYESDVYAFAVCMVELLSANDAKGDNNGRTRPTLRPRGITDAAWDLIKCMSSQDPTKRPTIHQVQTRLQRLAEEEAALEEYSSINSRDGSTVASQDVDSRRAAYLQQRTTQGGGDAAKDGEIVQHNQLQRELEDLRQKIRQEERELERMIEQRQRAQGERAKPTSQQPGESPSAASLPASLTTKQLLRILRWGSTDEQTQALVAIDTNRVEHSALEIVRNNGLDILVACMKHGHSSEFRQMTIDILQSITTAGTGLYLDAVLEHSVTQVLMGILHYRRVAPEQRRAGQFLVLLATRSARARSFFLQNAGLELLIKLLWQEQLPMFDKGFKARTDLKIVDEMRSFLATHAETRSRDGDHAMNQKGNHDLALQKFTEAIVLDPRNGRLYAKRSAVYAALRKYDHSAKDAQQCIRLLPQYGDGYFRHAIALYELQQVEQADRAVRHGRKYDRQYFTEDRLYELALHAPRGRDKENPKMWAVDSVEF